MSRLARFALLLACTVGVGFPSSSEAAVIPWACYSTLGPVVSMQGSYYTPYYTGYRPYFTGYSGYVGANYQPAAYSYGYATNGCCSGQQSSYYSANQGGCGCSPCGSSCGYGCSGGGCASGNCAVNSAPAGSLSPIADPSNSSRGIETRLEAIEKQLNIVPPRENTFPPREHALPPRENTGTRPRTYEPDEFNATPPRSRTRQNEGPGEGTPIPAREGSGTGTRRSGTENVIEGEGFTRPSIRNPARGTTTDPDNEPFAPNSAPRSKTDGTSSGAFGTQKVNTEKANTEGTNAPIPADPDLVIPEKKPAPTGAAVEETNGPQTLRLDSRITSKAVSPRERQTIVVGFQKPVVAQTKTPARTPNWAGNPRATDLAQHR